MTQTSQLPTFFADIVMRSLVAFDSIEIRNTDFGIAIRFRVGDKAYDKAIGYDEVEHIVDPRIISASFVSDAEAAFDRIADRKTEK